MNENQISPDDPRLTLYALGEMEPHEQAGFERLLAQDAAARQVVAEIRATVATVTAALEQEPLEAAPARPAGKVLRFPQAYFMISGLAAACFAVFFVLWQNDQELRKQTYLLEAPQAAAKETKADKATDGGSVTIALPPAPAAAEAPVPPVIMQLAESSPMPPTFPLQDSTRSASQQARADVSSLRVEADALREQEARHFAEVASAASKKEAERQVETVMKAKMARKDGPATFGVDASAAAPSAMVAGYESVSLDAFAVTAPSAVSGKIREMNMPGSVPRSAPFGTTTFGAYAKPKYLGDVKLSLASTANRANDETYALIKDNGYQRVADQPLSTFSIDVDTASYANVRRLLTQKRRPPADAVRIEELVNYFPYDYAQPIGEVPFAASLEVANAPWMPDHRLVRIGLKGREISDAQRPAANLVFLLDVSGSMRQPNKLPLVKQSLRLLVNQLRADDRVAIAVYAGGSGLALPSTSAREKATILEAIDQLTPGGSTNGSLGIHLAYDIAKANFVPGGVNRVILATDGDFNVGTTSPGELVHLIEEKAKGGVFLSVLGFGMGNLKDSTLESLADKGNGNYAYIDTLAEARKTLVEQAGGTLVTIAKDVKIQVEFNPAQVQAYRLIGYENRMLAKEDFNNDKVDAGEIGAGHTVTALYEVVPAGAAMPEETPTVDGLKYQKTEQGAGSGERGALNAELLTVKIRYKEPTTDVSSKLEFPLVDAGTRFADASPDFKFAAAVAGFGMALRESPHKGQLTLAEVLEWGRAGLGQDPRGYRAEFLTLVEAADLLLQ